MTCIVSPTSFPTKKSLREAVAIRTISAVNITDPSIFAPYYGPISNHPDIQSGRYVCVTNHPKRSWFAMVHANGKVE